MAVTANALTPLEGTAVNGPVARFPTTYTSNSAADLVASIDWGDGTTTTGTVTGGTGSFTVTAVGANGHSYADEGTHTLKVTVSDDAPGTAAASGTASVTVGENDKIGRASCRERA